MHGETETFKVVQKLQETLQNVINVSSTYNFILILIFVLFMIALVFYLVLNKRILKKKLGKSNPQTNHDQDNRVATFLIKFPESSQLELLDNYPPELEGLRKGLVPFIEKANEQMRLSGSCLVLDHAKIKVQLESNQNSSKKKHSPLSLEQNLDSQKMVVHKLRAECPRESISLTKIKDVLESPPDENQLFSLISDARRMSGNDLIEVDSLVKEEVVEFSFHVGKSSDSTLVMADMPEPIHLGVNSRTSLLDDSGGTISIMSGVLEMEAIDLESDMTDFSGFTEEIYADVIIKKDVF